MSKAQTKRPKPEGGFKADASIPNKKSKAWNSQTTIADSTDIKNRTITLGIGTFCFIILFIITAAYNVSIYLNNMKDTILKDPQLSQLVANVVVSELQKREVILPNGNRNFQTSFAGIKSDEMYQSLQCIKNIGYFDIKCLSQVNATANISR